MQEQGLVHLVSADDQRIHQVTLDAAIHEAYGFKAVSLLPTSFIELLAAAFPGREHRRLIPPVIFLDEDYTRDGTRWRPEIETVVATAQTLGHDLSKVFEEDHIVSTPNGKYPLVLRRKITGTNFATLLRLAGYTGAIVSVSSASPPADEIRLHMSSLADYLTTIGEEKILELVGQMPLFNATVLKGNHPERFGTVITDGVSERISASSLPELIKVLMEKLNVTIPNPSSPRVDP